MYKQEIYIKYNFNANNIFVLEILHIIFIYDFKIIHNLIIYKKMLYINVVY